MSNHYPSWFLIYLCQQEVRIIAVDFNAWNNSKNLSTKFILIIQNLDHSTHNISIIYQPRKPVLSSKLTTRLASRGGGPLPLLEQTKLTE